MADSVGNYIVNPHLPTCADCAKWVYGPDWRKRVIKGQPVPRDPGAGTPCERCPKSRDGEPNPGADLKPWALQALHYYRQCEVDPAGLLVPRDLLTVEGMAVIREAEAAATNQHSRETHTLLALAAVRLHAGQKGRG